MVATTKENFYSPYSIYSNRNNTDVFFSIYNAQVDFSGLVRSTIEWLEENQLKDIFNWELFISQYKLRVDWVNLGWRGEYWGKMMRGACLIYSITKSAELYDILTEAVKGLLETQDELGRISTYPVDKEFDGWDMWGRKYVTLGMEYYLEICHDDELRNKIIDSISRHLDYIISKVGPETAGKKPITTTSHLLSGLNSSSILEPFVLWYNITKQERYLNFAEYVIEEGGTSVGNIFEVAYDNEKMVCEYPVTKAYELMSCFEGLIEYYRVTKKTEHLQAILNFVNRLISEEVTIIGSAACRHEYFNHSVVSQADPTVREMQETCVTVTWMKLCYQMLCLTGDVKYANELEKSFYNAYLGSVNSENNTCNNGLPFDSYSPLINGTRGIGTGGYQEMQNNTYYGCCACIAAAGLGLYDKFYLMRQKNGFIWNLYSDAKIKTQTPAGQDICVELNGNYPYGLNVKMNLQMNMEENFAMYFRIPEWSEKTSIMINGKEVRHNASEGYLQVEKTWKNDVIELSFDSRVKVHMVEDLKYMQVGPVILARDARLEQDVAKELEIKECNSEVDAFMNLQSDIKANIMYTVVTSCGNVNVIDYASAGKTWKEDSKLSVKIN